MTRSWSLTSTGRRLVFSHTSISKNTNDAPCLISDTATPYLAWYTRLLVPLLRDGTWTTG